VRRNPGFGVLLIVESSVVRIVQPDFVDSFDQIVAQIVVAGEDEAGVIRVKLTGLVARPGEAGILGEGSLVGEAMDVADFSDDASGVNGANALDAGEGIAGKSCDDIGDSFVVIFELLFIESDRSGRNSEHLIDGCEDGIRQTIGITGSSSDGVRQIKGIGELIAALFIEESSQLLNRGVGNVVHSLVLFDEGHGGDAEIIGEDLFLGHT